MKHQKTTKPPVAWGAARTPTEQMLDAHLVPTLLRGNADEGLIVVERLCL